MKMMFSRARLAVPVAAVALLAAFPDFLHACPVCFDRDDEARLAFLATTGLLSLLPLGMVAGVGAWLRRRVRSAEAQDAINERDRSERRS